MARLRVCSQPGCPHLTHGTRCGPEGENHAAQYERARGTRQQRGYDAEHDKLRRRWKPKVDAGLVDCHAVSCLAPIRRLLPGEAFDLGHTPDRTAWTGPEHPLCNRSAGGKAAHA